MFSDPYRRMYSEMAFPSGDDAYVERYARRDALAVLRDAADRCQEQDMRTAEVRAALDFLKSRSSRESLLERFWSALSHSDVMGRRRIALVELRVIMRSASDFVADSRRHDF